MRLGTLAAILLGLAAAGCGGQSFSLDRWMKDKMFPPPTVTRVVQVESDLPDQRREALQAVAKDTKARDIESVAKLFCIVAKSDEDPLVRSAAVRGLSDMESQNVLETLHEVAATDKNRFVRCDAVVALGKKRRAESVPVLAAALKSDENPDVRVEAADVLRHFRERAAAEALVAVVEDRNIAIGRKAWESLRYMTGQDLPREAPPWTGFLASSEDPFARFGKPPPAPKGENKRPQFTRGIGAFVKGLFEKDVREAELE